jgi:hypothetical protein
LAVNAGKGHPELGESSDSLIYIDEFKHSLPEEYAADHQAEQEHRSRTIDRRSCKPLHYTFHGNLSFSFEMFVEVICCSQHWRIVPNYSAFRKRNRAVQPGSISQLPFSSPGEFPMQREPTEKLHWLGSLWWTRIGVLGVSTTLPALT